MLTPRNTFLDAMDRFTTTVEVPVAEVYALRLGGAQFNATTGQAEGTAHLRRGISGEERIAELRRSVEARIAAGQPPITDPVEVGFGSNKAGPYVKDGHHRLAVLTEARVLTVPVEVPRGIARALGWLDPAREMFHVGPGRAGFNEYHLFRDGEGLWAARWVRLPENLGDPVVPAVILGRYATQPEAMNACVLNANGREAPGWWKENAGRASAVPAVAVAAMQRPAEGADGVDDEQRRVKAASDGAQRELLAAVTTASVPVACKVPEDVRAGLAVTGADGRGGRMVAGPVDAYAALRAEAARVGLPTSFPRDLSVHDRRWCAEHDGEPFGWVLYERGTHLVKLEADRELLDSIDECVQGLGSRWYVWNGSALRGVSGLEELGCALADLRCARIGARSAGGDARRLLFPIETRGTRDVSDDLTPVEGGTVLATTQARDTEGAPVVVRAVESSSGAPWLEGWARLRAGAEEKWTRVIAMECGSWDRLQGEFLARHRGEVAIQPTWNGTGRVPARSQSRGGHEKGRGGRGF